MASVKLFHQSAAPDSTGVISVKKDQRSYILPEKQ
jgi:hypothetical protein